MKQGLLAIVGTLFLGACQVHGSSGLYAATPVAPQPPPPPQRAGVSVDVQIDFFGISLAGADDVVFVLDRSGSMGGVSAGVSGKSLGMSKGGAILASIAGSVANSAAGGPMPSKLEAAQAELIRTLEAMPNGTRFGVIFFDSTIQAMSRRMWVLSPSSRQRAAAFIGNIKPGGSTAAVPAMQLAYSMGARRVVLLSDGLANAGGNRNTLLRDARMEIRSGLRIDTVGLGLDQDDRLLQALARESGGLAVMR